MVVIRVNRRRSCKSKKKMLGAICKDVKKDLGPKNNSGAKTNNKYTYR